MSNKKILQEIKKNLNKAKAPAKKADIDYVSKMGYRDDSPFNKRKSITINTPDGSIDMSNTGKPLLANGKYLPPYSGVHQFNTNKVTEEPLEQAKKGGSRKYSKSLLAKNRLFEKNKLFKKKNYKNKIYDPSAMYFEDGGESGCPEGFYNDPVQGCIQNDEHQKWLRDWYTNRQMSTPEGQKILNEIRPEVLERAKNFPPYTMTGELPENTAAAYDLKKNILELNKFLPEKKLEESKTHELGHYLTSGDKFLNLFNKQIAYVVDKNIITNPKKISTGNEEWDKELKKNFDEIVSPEEIYARIMTLRKDAGFNPSKRVTLKDLEDYFTKVKDSGSSLNSDIEDLKAVTKDKQAIVNLLNDLVSAPGQTEDIPYLQPGGELSSDVSVSYLPNGERSYYNPLIDTVYLDPNASEEEFNHEMAHAWQNRQDGFRSDPYSPKLRPSTAASDEQAATYFNRKGDDVDRYINNLKTIAPELGGHTWNADLDRFIPDQLKYDKVVDPLMYSDPSTLEGEAEYMSQVYGRPPLGIKKDGGEKEAMNAMMKARLAYANMFGNPAAQRMINIPDQPYEFENGDTGTHYMASMDNYAVPQIQSVNGVLQLGDYGPESREAIRFDSDEDANYFAEHYKDISPGFIEAELDDNQIDEYRKGGYIVEDISVPSLTRMQPGGPVPDSTYTPIDPNFLAANPDTYSQIVNKPEVTSERQGSDIGKLRAEFREKNPMDIFLDEKKRQYLKKNKGLNKAAGVTMENFPEVVLQNFIDEYEYKTNNYAVNKLGKKEGWNPKRRGEWVDELTPGERDAVAESKYGSKLQPSYWSRSLAGVQELGNAAIKLLPGEQGDVLKYNIPGLTKKEQKEIAESKLGALETLAVADLPGVGVANLVKNVGLSTGSDYKELPNVLSGEKMANVEDKDVMAFNLLNYAGAEAIPELGVNLVKGVGKGVAMAPEAISNLGKFIGTEEGLLSNAYRLNPWAFKPNPEAGYRMIGGKEGYLDAIASGEIRPTGAYEFAHFNIGQPLNPNRLSAEELIQAGSPGGYKGPYMAEMKDGSWQRMTDAFSNNPEIQEQLKLLGKDKDVWQHPLFGNIKVEDPRLKLYKQDWLKGYKEVPKELPGSPNTSITDRLKQFFDRPPGPLMIGLGSGAKFTREVPNPDYFLDVMKLNKYSPTQKKYFESLIQTVKNQGNKASELQFEELQRIKTGDYNYGKRGIPYEALTVQKETPGFKSEINWRDWVKYKEDFDNNPNVIQELNDIEKSSKEAGTWMKNPDGTPFQGTPEQFVVQQSTNWKNAFPEYYGETLTTRSNNQFDIFDQSKFGATDEGYYGKGIYTYPTEQTKAEGLGLSYGPNEYELYVNSANKGVAEGPYLKGAYVYQKDTNKLMKDFFDKFRKIKESGKWDDNIQRYFDTEYESLNKEIIAAKENNINEYTTLRVPSSYNEVVIPFNNTVKSAKGNILFDMTNPNIYKSMLPYIIPAGLGVGAASQIQGQESNASFKDGGIVSELSKKEINKLIKQGYIIEEID
jgi:hypothetical protein